MTGNRIRNLRQAQGLTQKELAEGAGISENYVIQIEENLKRPHIKTLIRIASFLGVKTEDLY